MQRLSRRIVPHRTEFIRLSGHLAVRLPDSGQWRVPAAGQLGKFRPIRQQAAITVVQRRGMPTR